MGEKDFEREKGKRERHREGREIDRVRENERE